MTPAPKQLGSILVKPAGPDCNMSCTYCFYLKKNKLFPEAGAHRMSVEILEEMVKQFMKGSETQLSFGWQGGEPTLMGIEFFEKAVELQQEQGRGQSVGNGLQTNGLLINDRWAKFLKKYQFLVGLSLDGPEHLHDRYRFRKDGSGTWSKVVDSAKLMLDAGVAVNALSVVNDHSVRFAEETYVFHKELGLTYMQFIPILEKDPADPKKPAAFSVPVKEYGGFLCKLFDLWQADIKDGAPTTSIRFFDSAFYTYVGMPPPECTLLEECGIYVVVEHNGDVYSCDFFVEPENRLGNIMENGLAEMLNSPAQNGFGAAKAKLPARCEECKWLVHCRGGCPKDRGFNTGPKEMNFFCKAYQQLFEHADSRMKELAKEWKEQRAMEKQEQARARAEHLRAQQGKVGRNDPCPCKSGLKFKRCCGK